MNNKFLTIVLFGLIFYIIIDKFDILQTIKTSATQLMFSSENVDTLKTFGLTDNQQVIDSLVRRIELLDQKQIIQYRKNEKLQKDVDFLISQVRTLKAKK